MKWVGALCAVVNLRLIIKVSSGWSSAGESLGLSADCFYLTRDLATKLKQCTMQNRAAQYINHKQQL